MSFAGIPSTNQEIQYTFLLGRVHDKIGGPTRTIQGYISGLVATGSRCSIAGLGTASDLHESFDTEGLADLVPISGTLVEKVISIYRLYRHSTENRPIIVVGVWHLAFFVAGFTHFIFTLLRKARERRLVLVPTMSLTEYDWAKHSRRKKALLPVVFLILRHLSGVVFASSGELTHSRPASWRENKVILHPTISVEHSAVRGSRDREFDLLFAGRLDPQKDIPLLIAALSKMPPPITLEVVGDGATDYRTELRALADQYGVAERIRWHGWKSHVETLDFLRNSRMVVVTSLVENFCHVAVEALVSECDVVLVDRVMSAADFVALADIEVVEADASKLASAISRRLATWSNRYQERASSAANVRAVCSPNSAANDLRRFISQQSAS